MARNAELIRQWDILRAIDAAHVGITIPKLAAVHGVHQRTIRRDLEALSKAGFPLYDDSVNGTKMWKLQAKPFRGLELTGLSVTELCALYFCRSMLQALAGAPLLNDLDRAFGKLEKALPVASRKFLQQIPVMLKAKASGRKKQDEKKTAEILARVLQASLDHRRVTMRYDSLSSRRTKDYTVDPLRVSYAHGGIYLTAWVDEYQETRTFSLERIRTLAVLDEQFEPRPLPADPFAHSLGVHSGTPERIVIEFDRSVAEFVNEREWHSSQQIQIRADGSLRLQLDVCNDRPLRAWILGFGSLAHVAEPAHLAMEIAGELDRALERYGRPRFAMARMTLPSPGTLLPDAQPQSRRARAARSN
jgi:predicted DNA-binding transcriptional regulator YafY